MPVPYTSEQLWPSSILHWDGDDPTIELPHVTMSGIIGITVAISGNILISLALNLQKLAHRRLDMEKQAQARERSERNKMNGGSRENIVEEEEEEEEDDRATIIEGRRGGRSATDSSTVTAFETEPLLGDGTGTREYGGGTSSSDSSLRAPPRRTFFLRLFRSHSMPTSSGTDGIDDTTHALLPVEVTTADEYNGHKNRRDDTNKVGEDGEDAATTGKESDYLKSKLWWAGFFLMNVGEMGNFISYAFAPASVVAPLGIFALIANGAFAPLLLHERFRKREIFGVLVAIIGALTVVMSANTSDTKLDPSALIAALSQQAFVVYAIIYLVGMLILSSLSHGEVGKRHVFVDVGLCALFGGFTVLSTKGVSTLLATRGFEMFAEWISYPLIIVLIVTGVGQIRYLNRALMRFDGKVVIPIQFVLFNLSAIIGSAILYGDFRRATFHSIVTFLYGCAATFAGVFIIAWAPPLDSTTDSGPVSGSTDPPESERASEVGARANSVGVGNGFGSVSRRGRPATLVLSSGSTPALRNKSSAVSLMGLSPAQGLLLVHTPPREGLAIRTADIERDPLTTPDSFGRRRVISWAGVEEDGRRSGSQERRRTVTMYGSAAGTRESSLARNSTVGDGK